MRTSGRKNQCFCCLAKSFNSRWTYVLPVKSTQDSLYCLPGYFLEACWSSIRSDLYLSWYISCQPSYPAAVSGKKFNSPFVANACYVLGSTVVQHISLMYEYELAFQVDRSWMFPLILKVVNCEHVRKQQGTVSGHDGLRINKRKGV